MEGLSHAINIILWAFASIMFIGAFHFFILIPYRWRKRNKKVKQLMDWAQSEKDPYNKKAIIDVAEHLSNSITEEKSLYDSIFPGRKK